MPSLVKDGPHHVAAQLVREVGGPLAAQGHVLLAAQAAVGAAGEGMGEGSACGRGGRALLSTSMGSHRSVPVRRGVRRRMDHEGTQGIHPRSHAATAPRPVSSPGPAGAPDLLMASALPLM